MEFIEKNFFVIDSNNLDEIKKKLYGFYIHENGIIQTETIDESTELTKTGAYVYINANDDKIIIHQDFNGSYGLYLYQKEDYFALSNSFIKLVDYLKKSNHRITLNEDYANSFLFADLVSVAYDETLINEIIDLPRNCEIHINKSSKNIHIKETDLKENSIDLNSEEGIKTLDKWFYKWVNIFRYVKSISNNLSVDLTGGFDSRIVSAIWLNANINLDEIRINSYHDDKHCHPEDFRIASEISNELGFQINKNHFENNKLSYDNIYSPLFNSFYPKLCFHTEMYFKPFTYKRPMYHFTGASGECLRGYPNTTPEEYLKNLKNHIRKHNHTLVESTEKIFKKSINKVSEKYQLDKNSKKTMEIHYKETRLRLHYGKQVVESFLANEYFLNPFFDEDLYKLKLTTDDCDDAKLLFTLIFARFCPKLLNFDYEGGRSIDENTIKYAKELNNKFPLKPKTFEKISNKMTTHPIENTKNNQPLKIEDIDRFLEKIFYSKSYEMEFKKHFSDMSYRKIHETIKYSNYYPLRYVYTSIGILKIIHAVEYNKFFNSNDKKYWFDNFLDDSSDSNKLDIEIKSKLIKYAKSRIDIKNFGNDNKIEIIHNSDEFSSVTHPQWFKNEQGEGITIESHKGYIHLEIKCINDGDLKIWFRGINFLDKNHERFPIYINYINSRINGEEIINNKLVWHDEPIIFEKKVLDGDIIKIDAKWEPMSGSAIFNNTLKKTE